MGFFFSTSNRILTIFFRQCLQYTTFAKLKKANFFHLLILYIFYQGSTPERTRHPSRQAIHGHLPGQQTPQQIPRAREHEVLDANSRRRELQLIYETNSTHMHQNLF